MTRHRRYSSNFGPPDNRVNLHMVSIMDEGFSMMLVGPTRRAEMLLSTEEAIAIRDGLNDLYPPEEYPGSG